jgi:thioredoxin reductase/bacterioferritin-associated ferredoxin
MKTDYDLIIIGAGPAGMAAAHQAARCSLSALVLGEQALPGGQLYRSQEQTLPGLSGILGSSHVSGASLVRKFREAQVDYLAGASVWHMEPDGTVCYLNQEGTFQAKGRRVLIASGARERPMPIPGWTLPGVMAATSADVLLKSQGIIPFNNLVLAGSGPLLILTATRLLQAGAKLNAILDTTPLKNQAAALPYLPKALLGAQYLARGLAMKWQIWRKSFPVYQGVRDLAIKGSGQVESISFTHRGAEREIQADTVLLHNGLVPDTQLSSLMRCQLEWDPVQRYFKPITDAWGNTTVERFMVAGDAAGISGGIAAEAAGYLAALEATCALGKIGLAQRNRIAAPFRHKLVRDQAVRPFLDHLFQPARHLLAPADDETMVCRCEEVTAGQIRQALKLGAMGPNQLKTQTRAGMGACQGRMCGLIVSEIMADYLNLEVPQVGYLRVRSPIKPLSLGQLAGVGPSGSPAPNQ